MFKFYAAFQKELRLLLNDKGGLLLMFIMPLLLVYLMTSVQHSTTRLGSQKKIELLIKNKDTGKLGKRLITRLDSTGLFLLDTTPQLLSKALLGSTAKMGIEIDSLFSNCLEKKANLLGGTLMLDMGIGDSALPQLGTLEHLSFYYDPVLQTGFKQSMLNVLQGTLVELESNLMMEQICTQLELDGTADKLKFIMAQNGLKVSEIPIKKGGQPFRPNSSQHNVPAWTIFAMFFMVTSLGNNIIGERLNGSFVRLKTMPTNFIVILSVKLFAYILIALLQVSVIFSLAHYSFPVLGLPALHFPFSIWLIFPVALCCALSAVSYALLIGVFAKTQEQVNAFGAVSVVLLGAIGGIWVPSFLLPNFMQFMANFSPLYWCLDCFYILFLKGGDIGMLLQPISSLLLFSTSCFVLSYIGLKNQGLIR